MARKRATPEQKKNPETTSPEALSETSQEVSSESISNQDLISRIPDGNKSDAQKWIEEFALISDLMAGMISGNTTVSYDPPNLHFTTPEGSKQIEVSPAINQYHYEQLSTISQPYGKGVDAEVLEKIMGLVGVPQEDSNYPLLRQWFNQAILFNFILGQMRRGNLILMNYNQEHGPRLATTLNPQARAKMQAKEHKQSNH